MKNISKILCGCVGGLLLLAGSAWAGTVQTNRFGPVELQVAVEPDVVRLDQDFLLTLRVAAPTGVVVRLPDLADRLTGFLPQGSFRRDLPAPEGRYAEEYCHRLLPVVSDEYRLGPLPVAWLTEEGGGEEWGLTAPVTFTRRAGAEPGLAEIRPPRRVWPPRNVLLAWAAGILAALAAIWGLWRLVRRLRHLIRLRRMSPRARALYELERLMASGLPVSGKVKDFFVELTMIVRRYIERAHAIRAPEQTTEEFLADVAGDARFRPEVLEKLQEFLKAADLVKFAAWHPESGAIEQAVSTARDYIETE